MATVEEIAAGVGALVALLGTPTVYLGVRKSKVEIRKLEYETEKLRADLGDATRPMEIGSGQSLNVEIEGSNNVLSISSDPRLLGPLLLLLDFIVATIVVTIAGYLLSFGDLSIFSPLLGVLAVLLFAPILREAVRLKKELTPPLEEKSTRQKESGSAGNS